VVLPGVTKEDVLLDLDPMARKSYNAFQAGNFINVVDSERVGPVSCSTCWHPLSRCAHGELGLSI
jgi:hypothetical protein